MGIRDLFRKGANERNLEAAFAKRAKIAEIDRAQSLRAVGQYDQAIDILKGVIREVPSYTPALSVLAGTLRLAGRIEQAEKVLQDSIDRYSGDPHSPLIEWFATLGDIYQHDKDNGIDTALAYYDQALTCPQPGHIAVDTWTMMRSGVFLQLGNLLLRCAYIAEAQLCAEQRLAADPQCRLGLDVLHKASSAMRHGASYEAVCQRCGHAQEIIAWSYINVALGPASKEDVFRGNFNVFTCESCGETYYLTWPFLYHDPNKNLLIRLLSDGSDARSSRAATRLLMESVGTDSVLRIVRSREELLEKILILDAGLDDRAVETVKTTQRKHLEEKGQEVGNVVFVGLSEDVGNTMLILENSLQARREVLNIPLDMYELALRFTEHFARMSPEIRPGTWMRIDALWYKHWLDAGIPTCQVE